MQKHKRKIPPITVNEKGDYDIPISFREMVGPNRKGWPKRAVVPDFTVFLTMKEIASIIAKKHKVSTAAILAVWEVIRAQWIESVAMGYGVQVYGLFDLVMIATKPRQRWSWVTQSYIWTPARRRLHIKKSPSISRNLRKMTEMLEENAETVHLLKSLDEGTAGKMQRKREYLEDKFGRKVTPVIPEEMLVNTELTDLQKKHTYFRQLM